MTLMSATERRLSQDLLELKEELKEVQQSVKTEMESLHGELLRLKIDVDNLRQDRGAQTREKAGVAEQTAETTALEPFRDPNCQQSSEDCPPSAVAVCGDSRGFEFEVRSPFQAVESDVRGQQSNMSAQTSHHSAVGQRMDGILPGGAPPTGAKHDALVAQRTSDNGLPHKKESNARELKNIMNDESGNSADLEEDADESELPEQVQTQTTSARDSSPFLNGLTEGGRVSNFKPLAAWNATGRKTHVEINVLLEDEHGHQKSPCILTPNGMIARTWQRLTASAVIYIVGVVSFDMGFNWWKISQGMYIWGHIVDMWFWADMLVTFRTAYIHGGHLVMDAKRIAQHYFHFWFWVDLTANVPWERLITVSKSNRKAIKFLKWLKLPRLLRLGRLRKLMKANARYLNLIILMSTFFLSIHIGACAMVWFADPCSAYVQEEPFNEWSYLHEVDDDLVARHPRLGWECMQESINSVYFKAVHESTAMLLGVDKGTLMSYITGGGESSSLLEEVKRYAGYLTDTEESAASDPSAARMRAVKLALLHRRYPLSLANSDLFGGLSCYPVKVLAGIAGISGSDSATRNCTSSYFSGFNTQEDMNTYGLSFYAPMDVFGALMLLFGLYLQGLLFANLTRLLIARHHSETTFRQKHDEVKRELELYGPLIPESVQRRIEKHFEFRWINQAYGPLQILKPELLSLSLRGELALYLYKTAVTKVEFLHDAPLSILTKVCLNLEPQDYMLRDTIYRRGEYPSGIYLVDKGKVLLTTNDRNLVGDAFCRGSMGRISRESGAMAQDVGSGEHFGTGAAIAAIQVSAEQDQVHVANKKTAIAMTVCHLLCLSIKLFREICDAHPKFFWELKHLDEADDPEKDDEEKDDKKEKTEAVESNGHPELEGGYPALPFRKSIMRHQGDADAAGMVDRLKRMHQEVQSHGGKLDDIVSSLETLVLRVKSSSDIK